jgi:hypothetical protein
VTAGLVRFTWAVKCPMAAMDSLLGVLIVEVTLLGADRWRTRPPGLHSVLLGTWIGSLD